MNEMLAIIISFVLLKKRHINYLYAFLGQCLK